MSTDDPAKKARALELVLDAWDQALAEEVDPEVIASVAIYAAMADMVDRFGEEAVADALRERGAEVGDRVLAEAIHHVGHRRINRN